MLTVLFQYHLFTLAISVNSIMSDTLQVILTLMLYQFIPRILFTEIF